MFTISFFSSPWNDVSDEDLVFATRRGESSAFEVLYERRHKKIYAYLRTLLNYNYDDTVSLTSDVFIKFYEYIKSHDPESVKSLLYRIAHNAAIDRIRTKRSTSEQDFDEKKLEYLEDGDDYKHHIETEFKEKLFQKLLSMLDSNQRDVLYLYYYEGKTYDEIAIILNSSKNSIGTLIFNAKKKLHELAEKQSLSDILL